LKGKVRSLQDELVLLKTAIEEAITKGQKSRDDLNDIPKFSLASKKDFALGHTNAGSRVVS
jgi:hypothetical protein